MVKDVFLCDGIRTPIGRYGGALAEVRPDDLAAIAIKALLARNPGLDPALVDEVILGCANQAGEDNRNVARMALLLAGMPEQVGGMTVNRLCASGADAIGTAARAIASGEMELVLAGGVESMSRAPFVMGKAAQSWSRRANLEDTTIGWRFVNPAFEQKYGVHAMPETAENVADEFGIGRDRQDAFAAQSQSRTKQAQDTGYFDDEICTVTLGNGQALTVDEHPHADTTVEKLSRLKPIVRPQGTVTAGNSSGVNDGAAVALVASAESADFHGLKPIARILGMASAGLAPRIMGIGPVPASQKLTARLEMKPDDFDIIEINEAFAAQVLASLDQLGIDATSERVNLHGGAIALGHPLGASGSRLVITAARALQHSGGRRAAGGGRRAAGACDDVHWRWSRPRYCSRKGVIALKPPELNRRDILSVGAAAVGNDLLSGEASARQSRRAFPKGFIWGASTSSYQIEGNGVSTDIWLLEQVKPTIFRERSGDACDFLHLWPADLDLLKTLGLKAFRFSFEWARIEPEPGQFSVAMLDHYRRIHDIETGRAREIITLSGGETFIAALSLALGLSDIVEMTNGAIRLDTIFIDEGFGSLDTENDAGTLDQVLQVLQNIVGERRAVGLISHVPLVQQAVPNGFTVHKGVNGSQIEVRVG